MLSPVPVDQCRHSEIHLSLDVQMAILIAHRHFLAQDFLRKFVRTVHPRASVMPSFPPTDLPYSFAFFVN
jgi:hypothetical protein